MTILSNANLIKVLDRLVDRPSWKVTMATVGASERTAFEWRAQSIKAMGDNDRSSPFFLEWRNSWDFWHCHASRARVENIIAYEATIRDQALHGVTEVVHGPDQRVVYQEDPQFIGRDNDYVELIVGCAPSEVGYHRLLHDANGHPIPLTKQVQVPAQVRIKVLEQDKNYIHKELHAHDVSIRGEVAVTPALKRLPGEVAPDLPRLRALANMSPEDRRKAISAELGVKASAHPLDAAGRRTLPLLSPPINERADDQAEIAKPGAAPPFQRPPQPAPAKPAPRPSYARPSQALDQSGRGRRHSARRAAFE